MPETGKQFIPIRITLLVLLLAALWGGNFVAIKIGLQGLAPFAAAGVRFSIALPLIIVWARANRISLKPKAREYLPLLLLGLLFTIQIACLNLGTRLTQAGRATVMVNISPVCVAVLAHFIVPGDRLTRRKVIGLFLAFAGILIVFGNSFFIGRGGYILGDILTLSSGFLLGLLVVFLNRLAQYIDPPRLLMSEMIVGIVLFFLFSFLFERDSGYYFPLAVVLALLYQGAVVGGFCFIAWISVLKEYSPSRLTVLFFTRPLWGVILSHFVLGEPLTLGLGIGTLVVALGIYLVLRREKAAKNVEDTGRAAR